MFRNASPPVCLKLACEFLQYLQQLLFLLELWPVTTSLDHLHLDIRQLSAMSNLPRNLRTSKVVLVRVDEKCR